MAEIKATTKGICDMEDLQDEIDALQGDADIKELREYQAMETLQVMLLGLTKKVCKARETGKGQSMLGFTIENFLVELHRIENFAKQEFPPKEPSTED